MMKNHNAPEMASARLIPSFYRTMDFTSPLFEFYGKACDRPCEVMESAFIHVLVYIDEVLGFRIRIINYITYLWKHNEI